MKKTILILIISIIIIAAFAIAALTSLTPNGSKDSNGTFIPETENTVSPPSSPFDTPTLSAPTTAPDSVTPSATYTPNDTVGNITATPTPTPIADPTEKPVKEPDVFWISGSTQSKSFKYDSKVIASVSFYVPSVSSNNEVASIAKINSFIKKECDELLDGYYAECSQYVDDYDPMMPEKLSYTSTAKLYYTDSIISIRLQVDVSYGFGNNEQSVFCYNFAKETGEILSLDDVVNNKPELINAIIAKCEKMDDIEFSPNYKTYINTKICNEWYVNEDSICLVYKPYEIASGVAGTVEISVSGDFITL